MEVEIQNSMFFPYLYESVGIELSIKNGDVDKVFWDAALPGKTTEGIEAFLSLYWKRLLLKQKRSGTLTTIFKCNDCGMHNFYCEMPQSEYLKKMLSLFRGLFYVFAS